MRKELWFIIAIVTTCVRQSFATQNHGNKHSGGYSHNSFEEKPMPFKFGYDVQDNEGNSQSHKEEADASGARRGSYSYKLANGIYRIVDYVADAQGFRATIRTNEPGTDNMSPADVNLQASPSQSHYGSSGGSYSAPQRSHAPAAPQSWSNAAPKSWSSSYG